MARCTAVSTEGTASAATPSSAKHAAKTSGERSVAVRRGADGALGQRPDDRDGLSVVLVAKHAAKQHHTLPI